jgi:hypothetical protein
MWNGILHSVLRPWKYNDHTVRPPDNNHDVAKASKIGCARCALIYEWQTVEKHVGAPGHMMMGRLLIH